MNTELDHPPAQRTSARPAQVLSAPLNPAVAGHASALPKPRAGGIPGAARSPGSSGQHHRGDRSTLRRFIGWLQGPPALRNPSGVFRPLVEHLLILNNPRVYR